MPVPKDCYCPVLNYLIPSSTKHMTILMFMPPHPNTIQILSFLLLKNNIVNFIMIEQCKCSG